MKKLIIVTILASMLIPVTAFGAFSDVNSSTDYNTSIQWMTDNGIIDGYPDGSFKPDRCVNRAEILKLSLETAGTNLITEQRDVNPFSDVYTDQWYFPYVNTANTYAYINGYDDGTFRPNQCVNRVEAIKIAIQVMNNGEIPSYSEGLWSFADIDRNAWYGQFVVPALFNNLVGTEHMTAASTDNVEGGKYYPANSMTRKEVAEMLYRMKAVKDNNIQVYPWDKSLKPIANSGSQIAFDGCGTLDKYSNKSWFNDLEAKYAAGNYMEDSVGAPYGEGCLSLDETMFILIPSDYSQAHGCGRIFKYDVLNSSLSEAAGQYCAVEFGLRVNDYVQFTGHQNGMACTKFDGKYYFGTNTAVASTSTC